MRTSRGDRGPESTWSTKSKMSCSATVKWFDRKKGIGFATPALGGDDIFIHRRNFATPFTLDEDDEIHYDMGEYDGKPTAVKISVPIGKESKSQPRRNRGRNATKQLDDEADKLQADKQTEADKAAAADVAPSSAEEGAARPGGGRDSKTRRRPSGNRERRNDKGVAGKGSVSEGSSSSKRAETRTDAKQQAGD